MDDSNCAHTASTRSPGNADSAAFRKTMSQVPTPIFIVATDGPAGTGGFTASSVTSVSVDPPTMLVCINKCNSRLNSFLGNERFSINLLAGGDVGLADRFAGSVRDGLRARFRAADWMPFTSGCPSLTSSVFSLDCRLTAAQPEATHVLLLGIVQEIRALTLPDLEILVYHRREYRQI